MKRQGFAHKFVEAGSGVLIAAMVLSACTKSNRIVVAPAQPNLVPMSLGNSWAYESITYDSSHSVQSDSTFRVVVNKDTSVLGRHMFDFWDYGLCENVEGGFVRFYSSTDDNFINYIVLFRFPPVRGEAYKSDTSDVVVGSPDSLIVVPSGSFHCAQYRYYCQNSLMADYFVCEDVGIIKVVNYFGYQDPQLARRERRIQQLTGYTVD